MGAAGEGVVCAGPAGNGAVCAPARCSAACAARTGLGARLAMSMAGTPPTALSARFKAATHARIAPVSGVQRHPSATVSQLHATGVLRKESLNNHRGYRRRPFRLPSNSLTTPDLLQCRDASWSSLRTLIVAALFHRIPVRLRAPSWRSRARRAGRMILPMQTRTSGSRCPLKDFAHSQPRRGVLFCCVVRFDVHLEMNNFIWASTSCSPHTHERRYPKLRAVLRTLRESASRNSCRRRYR